MDNISRDSNSSVLPMAGIVVGILALILSAVALAKIGTAKTELLNGPIADVSTKADEAKTAARAAASAADVAKLRGDMQGNFTEVSKYIGQILSDVQTLKDAAAKPKVTTKTGEPVVAGKGEYLVKDKDTGSKIAAATGFTVKQLEAVNPGVEWNKLKVGQKLRLPEKK